jgi:hypothetical protein
MTRPCDPVGAVEFEQVYGPAAADKLFGPRHTCKPIRPIPITVPAPR